LKFRLVETCLNSALYSTLRLVGERLAVKFFRDGPKINILEKIRMKILAACKICSDVLAPVRSQPKMFAGAAQTRFCRTASSCQTQDLAAVPPPHTMSSTDDDAVAAAALIYASKSLNKYGILAYIILNFYDFNFHTCGRDLMACSSV